MIPIRRLLFVLLVSAVILAPVAADVGIGIKWTEESAFVSEGQKKCLNYGIYNPFDTDVTGFLTATKDLEALYESEDPKLIPAETSSSEAIPTEICFEIPKLYNEESILGLFKKRSCDEQQVTLTGEVMAAYKLGDATGTGSITGASFAAPLRLKVTCNPLERDMLPLYVVLIAILMVLIGIALKNRKR